MHFGVSFGFTQPKKWSLVFGGKTISFEEKTIEKELKFIQLDFTRLTEVKKKYFLDLRIRT